MTRIAFYTSGIGFGHAARDLRVIRRLRDRRPDVEIEVSSHGRGVDYYRARGVECHDLGFPEAAAYDPASSWRVWRRLARSAPADLVVTDEILSVIPYCTRILDRPPVLLTDFFGADVGRPELDASFGECLEIVVPDFAAAHRVPGGIGAPVTFTGPVVDRFGPGDRSARDEAGVGPDGRLVVVALGGRVRRPEAAGMIRHALQAFGAGRRGADRLVVLAGRPEAGTAASAAGAVTWAGLVPDPERWYRAADVIVADAMGFTSCEAAANGVPVVALVDQEAGALFPASFGRRVGHLAAHRQIVACDLAEPPESLWDAVEQICSGALRIPDPEAGIRWGGADDVVDRLLAHLAAETTRREDGRAA